MMSQDTLIQVVSIFSGYLLVKLLQKWFSSRRYRALKSEKVDRMAGHEFEYYVARLLQHQGYKTTVTKGSGDLGVDIIAHKRNVKYAIQCKRYNRNIPRNAISDVVAGKHHYNCTHAMVVTNQYFTPGAINLAKSTQCELVDRDTLALWVLKSRRSGKRRTR